MVINELFPDPVGEDKKGEWLELFNESDKIVNLSGWRIEDAGGKVFFLDNFIAKPRDYLIFDYKATKIVLNNGGEKIFLYDSGGKLIDKAEYLGAAPEGKSLARENGKNDFVITDPTPGEENVFQAANNKEEAAFQIVGGDNVSDHPIVINKEFNFDVLLIALATAIALALFSAIVLKKFDLLSD